MKVLGIDPGTKCGWALLDDGALVERGEWDCRTKKSQGAGWRWLKLRAALTHALGAHRPDALGYELVRAHTGTDAAQVYGAIRAIVEAEGETHGIPYVGINVATVKRTAGQKGNCGKLAMIEAAEARWGKGSREWTDNEADAAWVAAAVVAQLS